MLAQLEQEVERIASPARHREDRLTAQSVDLQTAFIVLHECSHVLFHSNSELRALHVNDVRQRVEEMNDQLAEMAVRKQKKTNRYALKFMPKVIRHLIEGEMEKRMPELAPQVFDFSFLLRPDDDSYLEEFACDKIAFGLAIARFINSEPHGEAVMEAAIEMFMALFILDYDRFLVAMFLGTCEEHMVDFPRMAAVRHACLREFIFDLFAQQAGREFAREFMHRAEKRDEGAKGLLIPALLNHLHDLAVLQHSPEGDADHVRAQALMARLDAIERRILGLLRPAV